MKKIYDEFTDLPVSRQRKLQMRRQRDGVCLVCKAPAVAGTYFCTTHHIAQRDCQRKRQGHTPRKENGVGRPVKYIK